MWRLLLALLLVLSAMASVGGGLVAQRWKMYVDSVGAFAVEFPGKPEVGSNVVRRYMHDVDKEWSSVIRFAGFKSFFSESTCVVSYEDLPPSWAITDLQEYFAFYQQLLEQKYPNMKLEEWAEWELDGYKGRRWVYRLKDALARREYRVLVRGTRIYVLAALTPLISSGKNERFFNSFRLLPLLEPKLTRLTPQHADFSVELPQTRCLFVDEQQLSADQPLQGDLYWHFRDSSSSFGYNVNRVVYTPFAWIKADTAGMLREFFDDYLENEHQVWYVDTTFQGRPARFMHDRDAVGGQLFHLIFPDGNNMYDLMVQYPREMASAERAWKWFHTFWLHRPSDPYYLFRPHLPEMIRAVHTGEPDSLALVKAAFFVTTFSADQVMQLLPLLALELPADTIGDYTLQELILETVALNPNEEMVAWLSDFFPRAGDPYLQAKILETLGRTGLGSGREAWFRLAKAFERDTLNLSNFTFFIEPFIDTVSLMRSYYRDFLDLRDNLTMRYYAFLAMSQWLERDEAAVDSLLPWRDTFLAEARRIVEAYDLLAPSDTLEFFPEYLTLGVLIDLLRQLPTHESTLALLQQLSQIRDTYLRASVTYALFWHDMSVEDEVFDFIHSDLADWWLFLSWTARSGHFGLLPPDYMTQEEVVRAYTTYKIEAWEEVEVTSVHIVERQPLELNGDAFTLYVVLFEVAGIDGTFLGICTQPQSADAVDIEPVYFNYSGTPVTDDNFEELLGGLLQELEQEGE